MFVRHPIPPRIPEVAGSRPASPSGPTIDKSEQGRGLGSDLFRDALLRSIAGADSIGGRAVLVHAKHDVAATFYRHHGFEPLPDNPMHLYRLMKDLRASLPQPKSN